MIYRKLPPALAAESEAPAAPLCQSKRTVYKLAALFSLDAFGGGFIVQSLLALWLYQTFQISVTSKAYTSSMAANSSSLCVMSSARKRSRR